MPDNNDNSIWRLIHLTHKVESMDKAIKNIDQSLKNIAHQKKTLTLQLKDIIEQSKPAPSLMSTLVRSIKGLFRGQ